MTEIQQFNPFTGEAIVPAPATNGPAPIAAVMSAVEWAQELDAYYQIAQRIGNTSFVPAHFRGKLEEQAMAMLYGKSLGMAPAIALRSIYSVHGTPALYAQQMYAIAIAHGHLIERVHATEQGVMFRAKRKGSQNWQEVEWTIERARKAKYTSNAKYQENPIGMLTEKCKAEAAKLVAADALAGMASVEEVELGDYDDSFTITEVPEPEAPKAKVTKIKRAPRAKAPDPAPPAAIHEAPVPEDDVEDTETEDDEPTPGPQPEPEAPVAKPSTKVQWGKLSNALEAIGVDDKPGKVREMQDWAAGPGKLGRELTSIGDLSATEADEFLAYLEEIAAASNTQEAGQ